jgi:hypothetical protein
MNPNHAPEYLETMHKLLKLIRRVEKFSYWEKDAIFDWMAYFWNKGTISYRISEDGVGRGICTLKFFSRLEQFLEPFVHEPGGNFVMIEMLVSDHWSTSALLFDELCDRWGGQRPVVLWDRGNRTEAAGKSPRMFKWKEFQKIARRMTNYARNSVN